MGERMPGRVILNEGKLPAKVPVDLPERHSLHLTRLLAAFSERRRRPAYRRLAGAEAGRLALDDLVQLIACDARCTHGRVDTWPRCR